MLRSSLVALIVFLSLPVRAEESSELRFLGFAPIGPLAHVRHGTVLRPSDSACRVWGRVGSHWWELDALGRIVGEVKVASRNFYDYSKCDELSVARVSGRKGAGIFVDSRKKYHAPDVTHWKPSPASRTALMQVAKKHRRGIKTLRLGPHAATFDETAFYFEWKATQQKLAVIGGPSLLIVEWKRGRWMVVFEDRPPTAVAADRANRTLAVTDMNGDGLPEVIAHNLENQGEWYGDWTYSLGKRGWRRVRAGIFGSTA